MKRSGLLFAVLITVVRMADAGTCVSATLDNYITLGTVGCSIGNNTLFGFQELMGQTGATQIATSSIFVTPSGGSVNPTIQFATSLTANFPIFDEALINYQIKGNSYASETVVLGITSSSNGGFGTSVQNYCPNGKFSADGVTGCPSDQSGTHNVLVNFNSGSASVTFAGQPTSLSITNDYVLDASGGGSVTGGSVTNSFVAISAIPEPGTYLLTGFTVLIGLVIKSRRISRSRLTEVNHE